MVVFVQQKLPWAQIFFQRKSHVLWQMMKLWLTSRFSFVLLAQEIVYFNHLFSSGIG
jgi:hypothetical protein